MRGLVIGFYPHAMVSGVQMRVHDDVCVFSPGRGIPSSENNSFNRRSLLVGGGGIPAGTFPLSYTVAGGLTYGANAAVHG